MFQYRKRYYPVATGIPIESIKMEFCFNTASGITQLQHRKHAAALAQLLKGFQYRKRYYPVATFVGKTGRHDMHAGGLFQYRKR